VLRVPGLGKDDELDADEAEPAVTRLVHQRLGTRRVQDAIAHEVAVHVVNPHRAFLRSADAPEKLSVPGGRCPADEPELLGRATDGVHERTRVHAVMSICRDRNLPTDGERCDDDHDLSSLHVGSPSSLTLGCH
jgi:hypothetical protein